MTTEKKLEKGCWVKGEPPTKDGKMYLLKFRDGIICSCSYRVGILGEPQQLEFGWRTDCCGRFATPLEYADISILDEDT